ncbi:MAG: CBS domain-containing protein [Rhodanobacteraceae bacterium]
MLQVKHLLQEKGSEIFTIEADKPVLDAIRQMAERGIGSLLVMRGEELVGIVSERDYARKVILKGRSSAQTPVAEIMATSVLTIGPADTVETCMRLCTDQRVRYLPVIEDGKVVGLLSLGDLIKAVISEQTEQIEQLQRYIAG